jgi:hypothetical protein
VNFLGRVNTVGKGPFRTVKEGSSGALFLVLRYQKENISLRVGVCVSHVGELSYPTVLGDLLSLKVTSVLVLGKG